MSHSSLMIQHCICYWSWKINCTVQKKISIGKKKKKSLHNSLTYPNLIMLSGLPKRTELQECLTTLKRVRNIHNMLWGSLYAIDPLRSCHPSTSSSRIQIFQTESNVVIWRMLDIWILKMVVVSLNDWFGEKDTIYFFRRGMR